MRWRRNPEFDESAAPPTARWRGLVFDETAAPPPVRWRSLGFDESAGPPTVRWRCLEFDESAAAPVLVAKDLAAGAEAHLRVERHVVLTLVATLLRCVRGSRLRGFILRRARLLCVV